MSDKAWGEIMDEMDNEAKYAPPSNVAALTTRIEALEAALREAIAVFESWHDDETEVELLPQLRAALAPEQDK